MSEKPLSVDEEPIPYEVYGVIGEPRWFRMYECKHLVKDEFPVGTVLTLGPHDNLLICRHCWQQIRGLAYEDLLRSQVHTFPMADKRDILALLQEGQPITLESIEAKYRARVFQDREGELMALTEESDGRTETVYDSEAEAQEARLQDAYIQRQAWEAQKAGRSEV